MNELKSFMNGFIRRSGSLILLSTIVVRLLSFIGSWIALKLLDNSELGVMLFAFSIVQFLIPIGGFGLHQSLIRYGAFLTSETEKKQLFKYVIQKGFFASLFLIFILILVSYFIRFQFEKTQQFLIILAFSILTMYLLEVVKVYFRLQHQNQKLAYTELFYSIILISFITIFSINFGVTGYAFAIVFSPLVAILLFAKTLKNLLKSATKIHFKTIEFWRYGFFAGLSNVVTQLLFVIDFILIGYVLNDATLITDYRYISIIPFSLLFLPRVVMTTDFVSFTEKITDKVYMKNYIKSYVTIFSIISVMLLTICWFFADYILLFFEAGFNKYSDVFVILIIGVCGIYCTRGLFGNLLSSLGKASLNFYIASIALICNLIGNLYLLPIYGLKGAAITSASLMWLTGITSYIFYQYYARKLSLKEFQEKR